jgi:hypothetical protein
LVQEIGPGSPAGPSISVPTAMGPSALWPAC